MEALKAAASKVNPNSFIRKMSCIASCVLPPFSQAVMTSCNDRSIAKRPNGEDTSAAEPLKLQTFFEALAILKLTVSGWRAVPAEGLW